MARIRESALCLERRRTNGDRLHISETGRPCIDEHYMANKKKDVSRLYMYERKATQILVEPCRAC